MTTPDKSRLTTDIAAGHLDVTVRTLQIWRANRRMGRAPQGPPFIKIGRRVYYLAAEIRRYGLVGEVEVEALADEPRAPLLPLARVPMPR